MQVYVKRRCGCIATIEPTNLNDDGEKVDVLVVQGGRKDICLDIRITNAVDIKMERGERSTVPIQGEMALRSEKEKNRKFQAKCKLRNFEFIPCIMETQGQWGGEFKTIR